MEDIYGKRTIEPVSGAHPDDENCTFDPCYPTVCEDPDCTFVYHSKYGFDVVSDLILRLHMHMYPIEIALEKERERQKKAGKIGTSAGRSKAS